MSGLKVVVIGGGTGSFVVLSGLKRYTSNITALVSMADDGGSTGQLRDELGALPPGDVRQCLVALSDSPRLRELFTYRFEEGSLQGHAVGNLFLTALEKMTGSFVEAVEEASRVLAIKGKVEPISLDEIHMSMVTPAGKVLKGQFVGAHADFEGSLRPDVRLDQEAHINPAARQAILDADIIVIAPGGLYTSLAPALIVNGVQDALKQAKAPLIYVSNLVTKPGQTDGFTVSDYASEIERFTDRYLDHVIYNNTPPSDTLLEKYAHDNEYPVAFNESQMSTSHYHVHGVDLVARKITAATNGDSIADVRSFIRHDPDKLAQQIIDIAKNL
ncbi:MAG: gluconeogenesis factor YvcK family protein [Candidatus Saccharimonadales bacterium]